MACGTGRTFTSPRVAERIAPERGRTLFAAPTTPSSHRRAASGRDTSRGPWTPRRLFRPSASARREDIRRSELEYPVTTDPAGVADFLKALGNPPAVFATYHSLGRSDRRAGDTRQAGIPIWPSPTRPTGPPASTGGPLNGVKVNFQEFHDDVRLHATKRP